MSKGSVGEKDRATASYMKAHPGSYPDSVMRPWQGEGSDKRALARQMGSVQNNTSKWQTAMLGGLLAARLGYGWSGVPRELRDAA
jgi:hypothetical protein